MLTRNKDRSPDRRGQPSSPTLPPVDDLLKHVPVRVLDHVPRLEDLDPEVGEQAVVHGGRGEVEVAEALAEGPAETLVGAVGLVFRLDAQFVGGR